MSVIMVLDCSVAISWFMLDEASSNSSDILDQVASGGAIVPSIWTLEVGNTFLMSSRNKRITTEQMHAACYALNELPITIDQVTHKHAWFETMELANRYGLTLYDASYLELSLRYVLPLATFDKQLKKAAVLTGVTVF